MNMINIFLVLLRFPQAFNFLQLPSFLQMIFYKIIFLNYYYTKLNSILNLNLSHLQSQNTTSCDFMGQAFNKDKNIDIYLQLGQQIFTAGNYLFGAVNINCHDFSPYNVLNLHLSCKQRVFWTEGGGKNLRVYHNSADTYDQKEKISPGHYRFPFKILLPEGLSGSFSEAFDNYIKYNLSAQLEPTNPNENKMQYHQTAVNILQPCRLGGQNAYEHSIINAKCCGCCMSYGNVIVDISCNKVSIKDEDQIKVNIKIDNTQGKKDITDVSINLSQKYLEISSWNNQRLQTTKKHALYVSDKPIYAGKIQSIQVFSQVPKNFSSYSTSIGKIIAKYFCVNIQSSMGCCSKGADSELELYYRSDNPKLEKLKLISAPSNWQPKIFFEIVCNNLAPFIYNPHQRMYPRNRLYQNGKDGQTGFINLNSMGQQLNYGVPKTGGEIRQKLYLEQQR